jgi:hypothetical protein
MSTALFAQRDHPALEAGLLLGRRRPHKVEAAQRCRDNGIGHSNDAGMQSGRVKSTEPPGIRVKPTSWNEDRGKRRNPRPHPGTYDG